MPRQVGRCPPLRRTWGRISLAWGEGSSQPVRVTSFVMASLKERWMALWTEPGKSVGLEEMKLLLNQSRLLNLSRDFFPSLVTWRTGEREACLRLQTCSVPFD